MISGGAIYDVLSALVPLYVAMILAYGSVKWWKIFSPDQCSGINRFVAVFAVPLLSFHFIATNNPYAMNFRFIAADSLQKGVILVVLVLLNFTRFGNLDWSITFFSLSTLPNTLVMGVPLLKAMYGDFSADLMVQIVVLQGVVWYTLLLFLFEYRGAKALILEQFPREVVTSIASVEVEPDVVSLGSKEGLEANAEMREDGKFHVVVRRSNSLSSYMKSQGFTDSDRLDMEIYSLPSSREGTPRALSLKEANFYPMSSRKVTDLSSDYNRMLSEERRKRYGKLKEIDIRSNESTEEGIKSPSVSSYSVPNPNISGVGTKESNSNDSLHMFVWSTSSVREGDTRHVVRGASVNSQESYFSKSAMYQTKIIGSGGNHASGHHPSLRSKSRANEELHIEDEAKGPNLKVSSNESPLLSMGNTTETGGVQGQEYASHPMPGAAIVARLIIIMVWRKLIRNPNTYASIIGLLWALIAFRFNIKLPKIIDGSITIMSNTGMGMAMFTLGLYAALQPKLITCGKTKALISMVVKFLVGPIVMAAAAVVIGIRGDLLRLAIVQAALPQGIVPFVFAKEYDCHASLLSTAVIFGMVVALPITIIYYILLGLKV